MRLSLGAIVTRADVPLLCADLDARLRADPGDPVVCDVAAVRAPDMVTVDALARLRLIAQRHGRRLTVTGAGPDLWRLVGLLGLQRLLEPQRQPEEGEERRGVEEVADARDLPA